MGTESGAPNNEKSRTNHVASRWKPEGGGGRLWSYSFSLPFKDVGYDPIGVEPVSGFVENAHRFVGEESGIEVLKGPAKDLPLDAESVAPVLLESVLEHVDSPSKSLSRRHIASLRQTGCVDRHVELATLSSAGSQRRVQPTILQLLFTCREGNDHSPPPALQPNARQFFPATGSALVLPIPICAHAGERRASIAFTRASTDGA